MTRATPRAAWLGLCLSLVLGLLPGQAGATGPSSVHVQLRPIAARNGVVLFGTRWELNPTGGHALQDVEYGWLLVGPKGLWKELPSRTFKAHREATLEQRQAMDEAFQEGLDWKALPSALAPLLRRYGLTESDRVDPDAGAQSVVWGPQGLCVGQQCTPPCTQRSLRGLAAPPGASPVVSATFAHAGLAVFRNRRGSEVPEDNFGPSFEPSRPIKGWGREGIELERVDGICFTDVR